MGITLHARKFQEEISVISSPLDEDQGGPSHQNICKYQARISIFLLTSAVLIENKFSTKSQ